MADKMANEIKLKYLAQPAIYDNATNIERAVVNSLLALDNDKIKIQAGPIRRINIFPREIWIELLSFIDIKTLTKLRHVCKDFRDMINYHPQYKFVYQQVPHLIRASLITGVGSYFNIAQLYEVYRSTECTFKNCKNDGVYVYLLTFERVCTVHVPRIRLCSIKPGWRRFINESHYLLRNSPRIHYMIDKPSSSVMFIDRKRLDVLRKKGVLPAWIDQALGPVSISELQCTVKSCLRVPWYDPATGKQDWGYYCTSNPGHNFGHDPERLWRTSMIGSQARTSKSMLKHFEKCVGSRIKWESFCPDIEVQED